MRSSFPIDDDFDPDYISKSEQKRAVERLQAVGEQLATLPLSAIKKLPISETLLDALEELHRLKGHEAIRRQKQLIGKLMRHENEDALLLALNRRQQPQLERQLSLWVERLLAHGESVINDAVKQFPAIERHTLRQYVRAALHEQQHISEHADDLPPKAKQKLMSYLREVATLSN